MNQAASSVRSWGTVQDDLLQGGWMLLAGAAAVLLGYALFVVASILLASARRVVSGRVFASNDDSDHWLEERVP